jgi:hypothetical protein
LLRAGDGPSTSLGAEDESSPPAKPRRRTPYSGTFEEELASAIKSAPWFFVSALLHAFAFALLILLVPARDEAPPPRSGILVTESLADLPYEGGADEVVDADRMPEELKAPEIDVPDFPEEKADDESVRAREKPPEPEVDAREMPEESATAQPWIGPSRAAVSLRVSRKEAPPSTATPSPPTDDPVNEDPDRGLEVTRQAAARVRDAVLRGGGTLGTALSGLRREDILVVRGSFDHMEVVLEELRLPYTLVSPFEIAESADGLKAHKVVFWNCTDPAVALLPRARAPLAATIRDFVRGGGYLFTTDWAVSHLVAPAFPGHVATSGAQRTLPEMIIDVQPGHARDNPLLEGVFPEGGRMKWWLESASQDVQVVPGAAVDVLVESPTLSAPPYSRSPVVAATFAYGQGRVLHVMGHYYQQKGTMTGAAGAQRLALNFVRMRLEKDGARR